MNTLLITVVLAFIVILAVVAMMSIGVANGRRPISGSCGGLNNGRCELCSTTCRKGRDECP